MGQKDFVWNVLFLKKNIWKRRLSSRKGDNSTWDLGRPGVKSLDWMGQNRDLNQCFPHPVCCHNYRASCRHLKFYWEPERTGLSLRWYYRRVVLLVVLHFNFDKTGTNGVNNPFPDLLYYWMTRSISLLGLPLCCSLCGRKGPPGEGVHSCRLLLCSDCSWQQQLAVTFSANSFWSPM